VTPARTASWRDHRPQPHEKGARRHDVGGYAVTIQLDAALRTYLFTEGSIVGLEEAAATATAPVVVVAEATQGTDLGIAASALTHRRPA
jgi:hypothetical protein